MTKRSPVSTKQNIFIDSEELDSNDLITEQNYNNNFQSSLINNHIGNGVLSDFLVPNVLFDSSLVSGLIDGLVINTQNQPSDNNFGNQLEVELSNSTVAGKKTVKVAIIGLDFQGNLQYDTFTFKLNEKQVTKKHYTNILAILFNDFIGQASQSFNLGGKIVIREAQPFTISRDTIMSSQDIEPNLFWRDFYVTGALTLQSLLTNALPLYNIDNLGIKTGVLQYTPITQGDVTTQVGEKFLATTNNIQKISLLLAVQNTAPGQASNLVWHGDLIVSIYPLQSTVSYPTDILPNLAIDYPPSNIPLAQLSFNYNTLQATGVTLDGNAQPVDFVFSNTLVAKGNTIVPGQYYAVTVKRSGSADQCDILIATGNNYDSNSRVTTFNGSNWVDIADQELWYRIWTDSTKVSDGQAYETGHGISIPKVTLNPNTNTQVDYCLNNIEFTGNDLYTAVVSATSQSSEEVQDPRTGNPVNTRQQFTPTIQLLNPIDLANLQNTTEPFTIGLVKDENQKSFDSSSSTLAAGIHSWTFVNNQIVFKIIDDVTDGYRYDSSLNALVSNIVNGDFEGAQFIPDVSQPTINYRVSKAEIISMIYGDVNGDGIVDDNDLALLNQLIGRNLNNSPPASTQIITSGTGSTTTVVNGYTFYTQLFLNDSNISFKVVSSTGTVVAYGSDGVLIVNPNDGTLATFESQSVNFSTITNLSSYNLVITTSSAVGNIGSITIVSLDNTSNNIIDIQKPYYTSDIMMQILRADIDGDFSITTEDGYYLQQYINRALPFPISTAPISKIGTSFSAIRLTVDPFVYTNFGTGALDRTDDFQTVSGNRAATLHTTPDIFSNDGYFASHDFKNHPVTFNIIKQFTWDDSLVVINSNPRLVPSIFSSETGMIQRGTTAEGINYDVFPTIPSYDPGVINSFVPNNLIIGNGDILNPDGSFYKVDFEIATIILEVPSSFDSEEKTIDIFQNFVYNYNNGLTKLGYPALQFGDGTFVTDTALNDSQVQFSASVQSFSPNINGISSDGYDGVIVDGKIGVSIDYATGLLTLNFSNLYEDSVLQTLNTKIQVNVFLKKSGFNNKPLFVNSSVLANMFELLSSFDIGVNINDSGDTGIVNPATPTSLGTIQLAGDISGTATSPEVVGIRGYSLAAPTGTNTYIGWNGSVLSWTTPSTFTAGGDLTGTGTSQTVSKIQGITLPSPSGTNTVLTYNGGSLTWSTASGGSFTAGGDLIGSSTSQTVSKLNGHTLTAGTFTLNQVLLATSAGSTGTTGYTTINGDLTPDGITAGKFTVTGLQGNSVTSGSVSLNQLLLGTSSGTAAFTSLSGDLTAVATPGNFIVTGLQGKTLPSPTGTNTVLTYNGTSLSWSTSSSFTAGGDLTGSSTSQQVISLTGQSSLASGTATTNYISIFGNNLSWLSTNTAPTITQAATSTASVTGKTLTISAQNTTGTTSTGGNLNLSSGSGTTSAGTVNLQAGGNTVLGVGTGLITLAAGSVYFTAGTNGPTVGQSLNSTNGATAQNLTIAAQSATGTTSTGGNLVLQAGTGTSTNGMVLFEVGTTVVGGADVRGIISRPQSNGLGFSSIFTGSSYVAVSATDSSGNLYFGSDGAYSLGNMPNIVTLTGGTRVQINYQNNTIAQFTSSNIVASKPIVGDSSSSPFSAHGYLSITLPGVGGTTTLTASQFANEHLEVTGSVAGNSTIVFPTIAGYSKTIINSTTGGGTVYAQTSGGTSVVIPSGASRIFCDGTNVRIAVTPGGTGSFTAGGDLSGSSSSQTVVSLTGTSSTVSIVANTLQWLSSSTTPKITQSNNTTASATAASLTIAAQSATGTTSTGGNLVLQAGTGTSANGIINIPTAVIQNQIATSQGTYSNIQTVTTTSTSASNTTVFTVPTGFMGRVDVTISGRQGSTGAGQQTWSGKVWNASGTAAVVKAFAPSDSFDTIGTFAPTLSVALSGNNVVVTVTPAVSTSTTFTYVTSVASTS